MRATLAFVLILVSAAVVSSCAQTTGRWTRADYETSQQLPVAIPGLQDAAIQESDLTDVSARIFIVSDNQRHELLGSRVDWYRNTTSDDFLEFAIRPPQLDLFGQGLLTEALGMMSGFVLHHGDACDLSNTGEFGRFAWDMRSARDGWVMAPGNHDGYFYGNSTREFDYLVREWNNTGESYTYGGTKVISRAMQKDRYVSYYLAALMLQDAAWSRPLALHFGDAVLERFDEWQRLDQETVTFADYWPALVALQEDIYRLTDTSGAGKHETFRLPDDLVPSGEPHLRQVAWHIDKKDVWKSFVLQEVDISGPKPTAGRRDGGVSILVVDTASYKIKPQLEYTAPSLVASELSDGYFDVQNAGMTGGMPAPQAAAADEFAGAMTERQHAWIMASHHPFADLGRNPKKRFNELRDAGGVPVSLSAHTHHGGIRWNTDDSREGDWLEINVGSVLDAPIEFRDLQVHRAGDRQVISSHRRALDDLLRERGLILDEFPGYRPGPDDPDYYLSYKSWKREWASDTNFMVKRVLLGAYARMFGLFPPDLPDDGSTYWPTAPDGVQLSDHEAVLDAIQAMLAGLEKDDVPELTQFLYELREYDRTRRLTDATHEQLRVYRLTQAIWAGQAEYEATEPGENTMDANLAWFVLPAGGSRTRSLTR